MRTNPSWNYLGLPFSHFSSVHGSLQEQAKLAFSFSQKSSSVHLGIRSSDSSEKKGKIIDNQIASCFISTTEIRLHNGV